MKRNGDQNLHSSKRIKVASNTSLRAAQNGHLEHGESAKSPALETIPTHHNHATQKPESVDALTALESILIGFATKPEEVESILGSGCLEPTRSLLSLLLKRKKSLSLDSYFPSAIRQPVPSPSVTGKIRPFDGNTVPRKPFILPELPAILPGQYSDVWYVHRSVSDVVSSNASRELNYERLEFLGDSYLSIFASTLIFSRFPHLLPGQQSTLRQALVCNDTLMRFSRAYGFDKIVQVTGTDLTGFGLEAALRNHTPLKGNKGLNKILADVFEAYVAAAILSDAERGFRKVEKWLTELWTPILLENQGRTFAGISQVKTDFSFLPRPKKIDAQEHDDDSENGHENVAPEEPSGDFGALPPDDPTRLAVEAFLAASLTVEDKAPAFVEPAIEEETYNPLAKADLQKRIAPCNVHLIYKESRPPKKISPQLPSVFTIAVYLSGWGYENKFLGEGQGPNKIEAGNRAAMDAMSTNKALVEECAAKFEAEKEQNRLRKEENFQAKMKKKSEGG
ncbi:hypothetical protein ANO11243_047760 [Dothideomycetidae sp. 11243]|nr:hypothetical protein ANO11243_047760 [fungal sp. No.11243]